MAFEQYSEEFAKRFGNMSRAAERQRAADDSASQNFAEQIHSDMAQEDGGPTPPAPGPEGRGQFDQEVERDSNMGVDAMKEEMLRKAKTRMGSMAPPDF